MYFFHLVRKKDDMFLVEGAVFSDGYVVVRWNATQNMPINKHGTGSYESIPWFLAVHGREGDAVMKQVDGGKHLFHLARKKDHAFLVEGVMFSDGYVIVRWNATQNMPIGDHDTDQFKSVEWFLAKCGREGEAVIKYLDEKEK
jgi:hypothetical protein